MEEKMIISTKPKRMLCLLLIVALTISLTPFTSFATTSKNKDYDPLVMIQNLDDCSIAKSQIITNVPLREGTAMKKSTVTNVTLSDGTVAVYQKLKPQHGGTKYSVTEGDLKADLEITPKGDMYINNHKVKVTEDIVTEVVVLEADTKSDIILSRAGSWSKWTSSPLYGNENSYTKCVNKKYSNIIFEDFLMSIPETVLLTIIGNVVTGWAILGTTVAKQVKTFYYYVSLNPKEINFYQEQWQPKNYYQANQYKVWWLKNWKGSKLHTDPQIRYLTIG